MDIILASGTKKNNYHGAKKSKFLKDVIVWKNFTVRSSRKHILEPLDPEWWMPMQCKMEKDWLRDESELALEWANREYELDYSQVEFKRANGY